MENSAAKFSIQSLIDKALSNREEYTKNSWWATDLGGKCLAGAYYRRLGTKPSREIEERVLRVFKAGQLFEDFVINTIQNEATSIETQVRIELPEHDLTGKVDVIVNGIPYELKTVHSDKFWYMEKLNKGPDLHYKTQLWVYLEALKKEQGRLVLISKDDLTIKEYIIFRNDEELRKIVMEELSILNQSWQTKIPPLPPPAVVDGKVNWMCRYCNYHDHCTGNPNWLAEAEAEVKKLKVNKKK